MIKLITGLIAIGGCIFGAYKYRDFLSKIKKIKTVDIQFVQKWIANQDMEHYNKSYTAVMLRGDELPNSALLKVFFDINKLFALCIYDKNSNTVVTKEFFLAENISEEIGSDDFIEFPFE